MREKTVIIFLLLVLWACAGCSTTPEDGALKAGQMEKAAELYAQGAELGDADAALKLGMLVSNGTITDPRYGTAFKWYLRACELGSRPGCHNVGVCFQEGKHGVEKSFQKAHEYYLKAAERGYMQSQYNLANLYAVGDITPPDDVEGLKWMFLTRKAAEDCKGVTLCDWILQDPGNRLAMFRNRMSEEQIKEAEERAREWKEKK
jgi:hypothetical protein